MTTCPSKDIKRIALLPKVTQRGNEKQVAWHPSLKYKNRSGDMQNTK